MKTLSPLLLLVLLGLWFNLSSPQSLKARKLYYLEEFYGLYALPHKFDNQDLARNIHWLQIATNRPFAPPIHGIVVEDSEIKYRKYQQLLIMHIHYLLTKNFVYLAARFDKHKPIFYNKPYRKDILSSLKIAEYLYNEALREWANVIRYYYKITDDPELKKIKTQLTFPEDMIYRINTGELDYERVINRRLNKISEMRSYFGEETGGLISGSDLSNLINKFSSPTSSGDPAKLNN